MKLKLYSAIILSTLLLVTSSSTTIGNTLTAFAAQNEAVTNPVNSQKVPVTVNYREIAKLPELPGTIKTKEEIIPKGWSLLDSLENDFNEDGLKDIIGIIEHPVSENIMYPRILFIYFNTGNGYSLNLMNQFLIRNADEGGAFGDPYDSLSASKNTFTTNAYGGSAWKWSESNTFEFKNGQWYVSAIKTWNGYGPFETSYYYDNYNKGIGLRRVSEVSPEKKNPKKLKYYIKLDQQPLLEDYSYTCFLSEERIKAPEIKSVGYNTDITKFRGDYPELNEWDIMARNKDFIIYKVVQSDGVVYIGVYDFLSKNLQMIARYNSKDNKEEDFSELSAVLYNNRLYYTEDISKLISVNNNGKVTKKRDVVAVQLISMNLDGSDKKVIFRANNSQYKKNKVYEYGLDYMSLIYEITGNEIIVEVYDGNKYPYYRMNLQGGDKKLIGSIPKGDGL